MSAPSVKGWVMSADANDGPVPRPGDRPRPPRSPAIELILRGELAPRRRLAPPRRQATRPREEVPPVAYEVVVGAVVEGVTATLFGQAVDLTNTGLASTGRDRVPGTPFTIEDVVEVPAVILDRLRVFSKEVRREIASGIAWELGLSEPVTRAVGHVAAAVPLGYDSVLAMTALGLRVGGGLLQVHHELHPPGTTPTRLYPTLVDLALSGLVPAVPAATVRRSLADHLLQGLDLAPRLEAEEVARVEAAERARVAEDLARIRAEVMVRQAARAKAEEVARLQAAQRAQAQAQAVPRPIIGMA